MQHMIIIIIAATNTTTFLCFLNASFIVSESPYIFYKCIVTYTYFLDRRSHTKNTTLLVLKIPKTESSVRKVFLPRSVAEMLQKWKLKQLNTKAILGEEYNDYNLVMTSEFGSPLESGTIRVSFNKLIEEQSAAGAAHWISRTKYNRITDLIRKLNTCFYTTYN